MELKAASPPIKDPIYSDIYNAEIFKEIMYHQIRWCKDLGGWFIYNGKYWQKDNNDNIKKYAITASRVIADRMIPLGSKAYGNYKRIQNNNGMSSMTECAKAFMGIESSQFDNNEYLINCNNGTYDLYGDNFKSFDSNDLITKSGHAEYKLGADCPLWEAFLKQIFLEDAALIEYIQRVMGYSLTASTKEQCMFILYGHGNNGKNVFMETISSILGDYAINCPSSMFVLKQTPGIPNDVARLKGVRMATASETNQNVNLDEELIKQLTGNKTITARFLNKEFFDFTATFKIFLSTNHKPNIRGTDTGIWRRIQMIPFRYTVTKENEDKNLNVKLLAEKQGIFNWLIEGHKKWNKKGLDIPKIVIEATKLYREEEDDLGQFIKQECIVQKGGMIGSHEFGDRFKEVMGYPKGKKMLGEYMARNGFKPNDDNRYLIKGKQQRGFVGIRWATELDKINNNGWEDGYGE